MDPLRDLLATDSRQVLEFFVVGLRDLSGGPVDHHELLYNASVLAHHALVSTQAVDELPTPTNLGAIFDYAVSDPIALDDLAMLEAAGAQCLLLAGFFEDQMRRRYNIRWYADLGVSFFSRAAAKERSPAKALLLDRLARHFEPWRQRHAQLSRELRDLRYVMSPP